jgi:hypothetical protein
MSAPIAPLIAAVVTAGGTIERHGNEIRLAAAAPLPDALLERLRAAKPALLAYLHDAVVEPLLLRDGRRLWRFRAEVMVPRGPSPHLVPLIECAREFGIVLVADGDTLVVVEPWQSSLPPETLRGLQA